jgi:hypothetical protein
MLSPRSPVFALLLLYRSEAMSNTTKADNDVGKRVDEAFRAFRQGDAGPSSELLGLGATLVPHVGKYVGDSSEDVRGHALAVIAAIGGADALRHLIRGLRDASPEIQERTANALYDRFVPEVVVRERAVPAALRASVQRHPSAAAILLLAYCPGKETERVLGPLTHEESLKTKLHSWERPVSVALPSLIAGSRVGLSRAREALLERIEAGPLDELQFILVANREIDAPEVLHALARTLDDDRLVPGGVPSGVPQRRLRDLAVDAYVQRLQLKPVFPLNPAARYSQPQIDEIKRLLRAAVPQ